MASMYALATLKKQHKLQIVCMYRIYTILQTPFSISQSQKGYIIYYLAFCHVGQGKMC